MNLDSPGNLAATPDKPHHLPRSARRPGPQHHQTDRCTRTNPEPVDEAIGGVQVVTPVTTLRHKHFKGVQVVTSPVTTRNPARNNRAQAPQAANLQILEERAPRV